MTVAGQERPPQLTQYALDRKTRKCVESNENWAYSPQIVLPDRVGHYGPLFPGGLKVGDTLSAFFNDPPRRSTSRSRRRSTTTTAWGSPP